MSELQYVKSINGKSGPEKIYDPDPGHTINGTEIKMSASAATTAEQRFNSLASNVRPLFVTKVSGNDYMIELPNGI